MFAALSPTQLSIQETARAYLAEQASASRLREVLAGSPGWDRELWQSMGAELGWAGLMVPEDFGGSGLGAVEMALLLEEIGFVLAPTPFFETAVAGVLAVRDAGDVAQRARFLPLLASGEIKTSFVIAGETGAMPPQFGGLTLRQIGSEWRLDGVGCFAPHGAIADFWLVLARHGPCEKLSWMILPAELPGSACTAVGSLDMTRPYARIVFDNCPVPPGAFLGTAGQAETAVATWLSQCGALLAAEQAGAAAYCLKSTVEYAKQRQQFGRPIGEFQAVKHGCAEMMLRVEAARSAYLFAADAIESASQEAPAAAAAARVYCSEALSFCAAQAIQLHGGIGFTWDHPAHWYFKRARASANLFGSPDAHREVVAAAMGLEV